MVDQQVSGLRELVDQSVDGMNRRLDKINGRVDSAHVKIGGHETALALSHERVENVASRVHDIANILSSMQKELSITATIIERVSARVDAADKLAMSAKVKAADALERNEQVEKDLSDEINTLKASAKYELKAVVAAIVFTAASVVAIIEFFQRLKP